MKMNRKAMTKLTSLLLVFLMAAISFTAIAAYDPFDWQSESNDSSVSTSDAASTDETLTWTFRNYTGALNFDCEGYSVTQGTCSLEGNNWNKILTCYFTLTVEEGAKISDLKITANSTSCTCVESGTDGVYDCCYKFSFSGFNRSLSYDATVTGLGTPVYFESSDTELGADSVLYDYIYSDSVVGNVSSTAQETEGTFMYWYDTTDQRIVSFDKTLTKTYDIKDNTARDALGTMLKAGHTYRAVFESGGNGTVTVTLFDGISDTILTDHKSSYGSSPEYAGFFLGYFNGATIKTNPYMTYDHETYSSYGYSTFDEYLSYIKSTCVSRIPPIRRTVDIPSSRQAALPSTATEV
jgi:hypothetical protein